MVVGIEILGTLAVLLFSNELLDCMLKLKAGGAFKRSNGIKSVSYTHLDVYKRQQYNLPNRSETC